MVPWDFKLHLYVVEGKYLHKVNPSNTQFMQKLHAIHMITYTRYEMY